MIKDLVKLEDVPVDSSKIIPVFVKSAIQRKIELPSDNPGVDEDVVFDLDTFFKPNSVGKLDKF